MAARQEPWRERGGVWRKDKRWLRAKETIETELGWAKKRMYYLLGKAEVLCSAFSSRAHLNGKKRRGDTVTIKARQMERRQRQRRSQRYKNAQSLSKTCFKMFVPKFGIFLKTLFAIILINDAKHSISSIQVRCKPPEIAQRPSFHTSFLYPNWKFPLFELRGSGAEIHLGENKSRLLVNSRWFWHPQHNCYKQTFSDSYGVKINTMTMILMFKMNISFEYFYQQYTDLYVTVRVFQPIQGFGDAVVQPLIPWVLSLTGVVGA